MSDILTEIETAITEVTNSRKLVTQKKTKQVPSADEIDRLKSVAYAWFQTHRSLIVNHLSHPDLTTVDEAYQKVLDATGKHAARNTYAVALQKAKKSLVVVRSLVATTPKT